MDNTPAEVVNYRREIILSPTLNFEIYKIGLPYLIRKFSLMMELISCKAEIMLYTFQQTSFMQNTIKAWLWKQISDSLTIKGLTIPRVSSGYSKENSITICWILSVCGSSLLGLCKRLCLPLLWPMQPAAALWTIISIQTFLEKGGQLKALEKAFNFYKTNEIDVSKLIHYSDRLRLAICFLRLCGTLQAEGCQISMTQTGWPAAQCLGRAHEWNHQKLLDALWWEACLRPSWSAGWTSRVHVQWSTAASIFRLQDSDASKLSSLIAQTHSFSKRLNFRCQLFHYWRCWVFLEDVLLLPDNWLCT